MNAKNITRCLVIGFLFSFQAGCQSASTTPEKEVVLEGESTTACSAEFISLGDDSAGIFTNDPELGEVTRAQIVKYHIDCGNPYVNETCVDIQDHNGSHWTSLIECVTDEGGVWKGICDSTEGVSAVCDLEGAGIYSGLYLHTEGDLTTFTMKYQVTRLMEP